MKKITLVLLALLIVASCIGLAACNNNAQKVLDQYLLEQDQQLVEKDFVLPAQISGVDVTWTSDNDAIQIEKRADDYLAKVVPGDEVTSVTLTVSAGKASKSFTVRVTKLDVYYLASKYIFTKDNATVTDDFTLDKTFVYDGKTVNITWSVDESFADYLEISEDGYTALVYPTSILPEVRIKATFSYGGETTTKSFKVVVGIERSPLENINYWYSNTDVSIEIRGYVVAVADPYSETYGNISVYVVDENFLGGYYIYRADMADPAQASLVVPGAYVVVTGSTNTVYNGLYETNQNGVLTVDTEKAPIDVSEHVYAFDQDLLGGVPAAIHRQSSLVSLTNWAVKSVAESAPEADKTATLFTLEKGGVEVTIAVSKYMKGEYTAAAGDEKWEAICALRETVKVGDIVSVEGILSSYNSNHQICLVDASGVTTGGTADPEGTVYPGQTAAKAIADVEKALTDNNVTTRFTKPAEFTLPTESNGVEIKYELCRASDSVVLDGAKFTVTPGKQEVTTVQITYTLKDGEAVVYSTSQFFNIESLIPTLDTMIEELEVPPTELEEDYKLDENAEWVVKSGTGIEIVDGVAKVTRSDVDQKVVLTATVTLNGETKSRDYYITIPADPFLSFYVINVTADALELGNYADGSKSVAGVDFAYTELGDYGNGMQWRIKDGKTASLKNTSAFHEGIKEIMITLHDGKAYSNQDAFSLKFGTSPDALGNEIKLSTVAGQYVYNIKLDGTATYFSMTQLWEANSFYIDSIKLAFDSEPTFSDADKISIEKSELKFDGSTYTEDATATLPIAGTTYTDVTISWAADNSAVAIDGANFTFTMPETSARIKLTATLTCGTATDTKEFILFAVADVLEAAKLMEDGDKLEGNFELTGTVKSIDEAYSEKYGNVTLTITVGDTDIECYRMKGGAAATAKVGDKLVVTGSLENYKGKIQFSSGAIGEFVGGGDEGGETPTEPEHAGTLEDPYTVADALLVAGTLASGEYTETKVYIKGIIKSIGSYGSYLRNVYLIDETGATTSLLVYSVNYSEEVTAVYPNDFVVVNGYLTNYNGTLEVSGQGSDYVYFTSCEPGESTVTFTNDAHATVENLSTTEGLNGSTFTFTVNVTEGYQLVAVKVNGETVEAVEGTYTGTIKGNTTITLETAEEGAALPQLAATLSFADKANRTVFDPDTAKTQVWEQNGIKFTNNQASSTSPIADYSDPIRCYASSDIIIEYTGIVKLVFTCDGASRTFNANSISGNGQLVVEEKIVTITFDEAVDSVTITKLTQQARIKTLDVYTLAE